MANTQTAPRRTRRKRGSIRSEDIVSGAFEIASQTSIDQLSMPTLAEHLDVAVTSIYWYFRKKEELLNAMTDVAVEKSISATPPIQPSDTWQDTLRTRFTVVRDLHGADEVLSDLLYVRTSTYTPAATHRVMEDLEKLVAKLVDAGFTPDTAILCINAISIYTRGIVIEERVLRRSNAPTLSGRQRRMTDWADMPLLDQIIDRRPIAGTTDDDFEFGLNALLRGFESALAKSKAGAKATTKTKAGAKTAAKRPAARKKPATTARTSR